jgi:hypothetical protein
MAIKAKNCSQKKLILLGKTERKTNVFLCCGQRAYVGYVGFGWKNLESLKLR